MRVFETHHGKGSGNMPQMTAVTVCCTAYNHEKYIRQCLDGFVMQKTDFPFEVLIHDDASTDGTAEIIREYEHKFPHIIKPIYQTENQYSKHIKISETYLIPRAQGEYITFCEGDDYWCDSYKLQKQVDAMRAHPQCRLCVHRVACVSEDGTDLGRTMPEGALDTAALSPDDFMKVWDMHSFQTSSFFIRAEDCRRYFAEQPSFYKIAKKMHVGDISWLLYFGQLAPVFYIDDTMSAYRMQSVGSWNSRNNTTEKKKAMLSMETEVLAAFDEYTDGRYHDRCEEKVRQLRLGVALLERRYRDCIAKAYRGSLKKVIPHRKGRMKIYLYAKFPRVMCRYDAWKERRRHGK